MKNIIFHIVLIVILFNTAHYGQETIKYNILKSDIEKVAYEVLPDSTYQISIKLNTKAVQELKKITKNNIGNNLIVVKDGNIIVEAIIKGEIDSGLIVKQLKSGDEVIEYIKNLLK
jgi:preprotein translocase subunit SecD